ncbi:Gfo/Idh/MocA family protein [Natronobiforma cellulositropha]|uniref:Gfo/Idh/MocA family protein n=1 Tax=Natronobiforma cellulositropha TaxID=1679076 RepID=UPI0021D5EB3F|nr:Gfo/Idh/MocA family oxidoreductase [Natronobiforma cellulositropha]
MTRLALVGAGGFGTHLAHAVDAHPTATLVAVADVDPTARTEAAATFGLESDACFETDADCYEAADPDGVIVATPPALHLPQLRRALERDCHVLCEKPVVCDLAEARTLAALADASEATVMAGYQRHLDPAFRAGYDRWHDGDAEPTFVTGELTQNWHHHFERGTDWRLDPDLGGRGHLFSVGTHVLESLLWMTGLTPERVTAQMTFYDDERHIDTQAAVTIRFENGALASLADTATAATERERLRIWDDDGAFELSARDWDRPTATLIDAAGAESPLEVDHESARGTIDAFVDVIDAGAEPPATVTDVCRVSALLDAIYEAAETGDSVAVDRV